MKTELEGELFREHTLDSKETWKKKNKHIKIFSNKVLSNQTDMVDLTTTSLAKTKTNQIQAPTHYYILNTKELFEYFGKGLSSVFEHFLSEQDISSLRNKEWITNFVMDSALAAVIKKNTKSQCSPDKLH